MSSVQLPGGSFFGGGTTPKPTGGAAGLNVPGLPHGASLPAGSNLGGPSSAPGGAGTQILSTLGLRSASSRPAASGSGVNLAPSVLKWGGAFAVYSIAMVSLAGSEKYGEVAVAFSWVVAMGAFFYWYNDFDSSLAGMIGQAPVKA